MRWEYTCRAEQIRKSILPPLDDCYTACTEEAGHFTYHIKDRTNAVFDDQGCLYGHWNINKTKYNHNQESQVQAWHIFGVLSDNMRFFE